MFRETLVFFTVFFADGWDVISFDKEMSTQFFDGFDQLRTVRQDCVQYQWGVECWSFQTERRQLSQHWESWPTFFSWSSFNWVQKTHEFQVFWVSTFSRFSEAFGRFHWGPWTFTASSDWRTTVSNSCASIWPTNDSWLKKHGRYSIRADQKFLEKIVAVLF